MTASANGQNSLQNQQFRFDDVTVDRAGFRVTRDGEPRTLTPRAFDVLVFLIEHRDRVVEKQELFDGVWGEVFVTDNSLTKAVKEIRQALGDDASAPRYVETVPRRGYRFVAELDTEDAAEPHVAPPPEAVTAPPRRPWAIAAAAVVLVALVAVALWAARAPREETGSAAPAVDRTRQITTGAGLEAFPAFSPDGGSLAYSSDRTGSFEICVRPLAPGSREVQVTSDGQMNVEPSWSPDGSRIAFCSQKRGGIWIVPAFGGVARRVTEFGSRPRWSPDGTGIVFQSDTLTDLGPNAFGATAPSTLWLVAPDGGAPRQLTREGDPPGGHGSPAWSPDGRRVVFANYGAGPTSLWSVAVADGQITQLTESPLLAFDPVWAPDGSAVFYSATVKSKNFGIWRLPVDPGTGAPSGEPAEVTGTGAAVGRYLAISPDGNRLAYTAVTTVDNVWTVGVDPTTGEPEGHPIALTSDTSFRKSSPAYAPDGRRVVYSAAVTGAGSDLWIASDGAEPVQITAEREPESFASWFPDGRHVAYLTWRPDGWAYRALDVTDGSRRDLLTGDDTFAFPRVSPDGRFVAFHRDDGRTFNVWTMDLETKHSAQVTFDREMAGWPCWSPDGAMLAVEVKRGDSTQVAVVPVAGGPVVELTAGRGQSWTGSWSPGGDRIAFAGYRDGLWNIWWVSRTTRAERQLTFFTQPNVYVRAPNWSPRGDRIAFEYAEIAGDVWLLELR